MIRRILQSVVFAIAALTPFSARAAVAPGLADVVLVQPARFTDLVVLGAGFDAGLRQGMICRITQSGAVIGEIILVDLRASCSSGLIINLATGKSIRAGDLASVKILKTKLQ